MGVNKYFAGPVKKTTDKKTIQIDNVETKAETAIY